MTRVAATLLCVCLLVLALPARGEPRARTTLALVIGSNRGAVVARPDLHFADDDAARYVETFRMLASVDDVALLTSFDRDSDRQHASLRERAKPPSRANVRAVASAFAQRVKELRAAGGDVDFYFVFAGHGDVDHGEGFLELEDGRFTSRDLEELLRTVSATRAHVILDSCNSVFMVSARKPGGHHFATGEAAARQLATRMPDVGVFLSTSAEEEVFEWSELGAGIFSHVVRSGLAGAADADGDGAVSYAELRAFVEVATRTVPNPRYRPQVFARGPGGRDDVVLFTPRAARAKRLRVEPGDARRVTVRDADDVPWVDAHCETGAACTLVIPDRAAARASVETYRVDPAGMHSLGRVAFAAADDQPVLLASLPAAEASGSARGPRELFRALFREPFGPRAFEQIAARPPLAEPVFGVTNETVERHRLLLGQVSGSQRAHRIAMFAGAAAAGALGRGTGIAVMAREGAEEPWTTAKIFGVTQTVVGATLLALSPFTLLYPESSERLHADFERDLAAHPDDRAGVLARAERRLFDAAKAARDERMFGLLVAGGHACLALGVFVVNEVQSEPLDAIRIGVGGSLVLLGATAFTQLVPTELERFADLWRNDPARSAAPRFRPRFAVAPTLGGGMATITGRF